MALLNLPIDQIYTFLFVLVRVAAMLFFIPFLDSRNIPVLLKVGLAVAVSVLIVPQLDAGALPGELNAFQLVVGLAGEISLGLILGFSVQLFFVGVQLAGQMAGFQMGLAIANVLDPASSVQIPILAQFLNLFALLIFLTLNVHHHFIRAMVEGFEVIPLMAVQINADLFPLIMALVRQSFIVAVKVGAPVMVALLLTSGALGLVARNVPQMQIFVVAMPLKIIIGLLFFGFSLPFCANFLTDAFGVLTQTLRGILRIVS
jgi:flagellar biosynthetic protein FliR